MTIEFGDGTLKINGQDAGQVKDVKLEPRRRRSTLGPLALLAISTVIGHDEAMASILGEKSGDERRANRIVDKWASDKAEAKRRRRAERNLRNAERMKH